MRESEREKVGDVDRKKGKERQGEGPGKFGSTQAMDAHLEALFQVGREEGWEP